MKHFYRKTRHADYGTESQHCVEEYGSLLCNKCDKKAKKLKTKEKFSSEAWPGGGKINYNWSEITMACTTCKIKETYDTPTVESDGSYYSAEETRVYGR